MAKQKSKDYKYDEYNSKYNKQPICINYNLNIGLFQLNMWQFLSFEEIYMFSNCSCLGWMSGLSNIILKEEQPMTCKVWLNLDEQFQMRRWLNDVCNNQPIFIKK